MGALTLSRKRGEETFLSSPKFSEQSYDHIAKKPKPSVSMNQKTPDCSRPPLICSVVSRISQYPSAKNSGFPRDPHAPIRNSRLGRSSLDKGTEATPISTENQADEMGNFGFFSRWIRYKWAWKEAMNTIGNKVLGKQKDKEVIEIDSEDVCDDSSIEELENLHSVKNSLKLNARKVKKEERSLDSSVVRDVRNAIAKEDVVENAQLSLLDQEPNDSGEPTYKRLWKKTQKQNPKLANLEASIEIEEKRLQFCHLSRPQKKEVKKDVASECFVPLTDDEKELVSQKLSNAYRRKIVVSHESSNIDITGEKLQCLRPKAWLNDEVINLYLELLKEREKREPKKFLQCHFFNTFFYKKLISGGYNYSSVRRWTTKRKIGYSLLECEKIFVPIHKEVHWCLAIINQKEKKFQYLDSLGGIDGQVLKVLARYFVDEVKDKCGKDIDVDSWEHEFVRELPEQENGYDCGVFMIKYADFYSRGIGLCFNQGHMPYFRERTAKEILNLRAE